MADLSTLDPTKPDNSELARQGASRIRDVSTAVLTSFGLEHSLAGYHKLPAGNAGVRPAPGNLGRMFINTGDGRLEYDNGSAWVLLVGAVQGNVITSTGVPTINTFFTTLLTMTVDLPLGGTPIIVGGFSIDNSGIADQVIASVTVDGASAGNMLQLVPANAGSTNWIVFGIYTAGLTGSRVVGLQARMSAAARGAGDLKLACMIVS